MPSPKPARNNCEEPSQSCNLRKRWIWSPSKHRATARACTRVTRSNLSWLTASRASKQHKSWRIKPMSWTLVIEELIHSAQTKAANFTLSSTLAGGAVVPMETIDSWCSSVKLSLLDGLRSITSSSIRRTTIIKKTSTKRKRFRINSLAQQTSMPSSMNWFGTISSGKNPTIPKNNGVLKRVLFYFRIKSPERTRKKYSINSVSSNNDLICDEVTTDAVCANSFVSTLF